MSFLTEMVVGALKLPEARAITDLDDPMATILHGQIIRRKPFLFQLYTEFYRRLEAGLGALGRDSTVVELGSGGGFIKSVIPSVVTSDILQVPDVDLRFSVERMPFGDESVDAFLMINVFHHVKEPRAFLRELDRTLRPRGRILMIEPSNTVWGRFISSHFHHEDFDPTSDWKIEGEGPLSQANGALPWIVFSRDRAIFEREFPHLRITAVEPHTPLKYLVSGGLSIRQLLPGPCYRLVDGLERVLRPFNRWLGMFYYVALSKG
jgi:SAM-dependent methyltransferase